MSRFTIGLNHGNLKTKKKNLCRLASCGILSCVNMDPLNIVALKSAGAILAIASIAEAHAQIEANCIWANAQGVIRAAAQASLEAYIYLANHKAEVLKVGGNELDFTSYAAQIDKLQNALGMGLAAREGKSRASLRPFKTNAGCYRH